MRDHRHVYRLQNNTLARKMESKPLALVPVSFASRKTQIVNGLVHCEHHPYPVLQILQHLRKTQDGKGRTSTHLEKGPCRVSEGSRPRSQATKGYNPNDCKQRKAHRPLHRQAFERAHLLCLGTPSAHLIDIAAIGKEVFALLAGEALLAERDSLPPKDSPCLGLIYLKFVLL